MTKAQRVVMPRPHEVTIESSSSCDAPGPGQVLVETEASAISPGTELAVYTGIHQWLERPHPHLAALPLRAGL